MKKILLLLGVILMYMQVIAQNLYTKDKVNLGKKKDFIDACIKGAKSKVVSLKGIQVDTKSYCSCMAEKLIPEITSKELMKLAEDQDIEAFFVKEKNLKILMACLENNYKFDDTFKFNQPGQTKFSKQFAVKVCVDELKNDPSTGAKLTEEQLSKYCSCAVEKLFASNMQYKDLDKIEEVDGEAFNELIVPCAVEAGWDIALNKKSLKSIPVVMGDVAFSKIDLVKYFHSSYKVKLNIGGVIKYFIFDTGASDMLIDKKTEEEFLSKGILKKENYLKGETEYELANNAIVKGRKAVLSNITIGDYTINNVTIGILDEGSLLLGKSLLDAFSKWEIQKEKNILILYK